MGRGRSGSDRVAIMDRVAMVVVMAGWKLFWWSDSGDYRAIHRGYEVFGWEIVSW